MSDANSQASHATAGMIAARAEMQRLRTENARLRLENARLRDERCELRATADAYVKRAQATSLFGPVELTAGTSIGPLRRRRARS